MRNLQAANLLDTFSAAGLAVSLTSENNLKVTPAKALTDELRVTIKANKALLVDYLQRVAANDNLAESPLKLSYQCWATREAMSEEEIDTFIVRLERFAEKGARLEDAERLADRLVIRDREGDDRRLCLEYKFLEGQGRWRCGNSLQAVVAQDVLAPDLVLALQRCGGYST